MNIYSDKAKAPSEGGTKIYDKYYITQRNIEHIMLHSTSQSIYRMQGNYETVTFNLLSAKYIYVARLRKVSSCLVDISRFSLKAQGYL